jgi:YaiO family outer membrane protein
VPRHPRPLPSLLAITVALAASLLAAGPASAQAIPFVEVSGELSPITIDTYADTWQVGRIAGGVQDEGRFGLVAGADRQRRHGLVDWAVHGTAWRHFGPWTLAGGAGYGHEPSFLYRRSLEGELARRVAGGLVLHGGYRHLAFASADVHLVQPAASYYFGSGYVQARGVLVRNTTHDRRATTMLLRGAFDVSPRVQIGAGTAIGTRIFDVAALSDAQADAWVVFGSARVRLAPRWTLSLNAGGAHEDPLFSQRTIGLGLRWERR